MKIPGEFENFPKMSFLQWSLSVVLIYQFFKERHIKKTITFNYIDILILIFLILCSTSLYNAINPYQAIPVLIHWWFCGILYFFIVFNEITLFPNLFFFSSISVGLIAIIGILQNYQVDFISFIPQTVSPAGTFGNKNMAAHFVAILIPYIFGAISFSKNKIHKYLFCSILIISFFYILLTGTRASWLAVLISLTIAVILYLNTHEFRKNNNYLANIQFFIILIIIISCFYLFIKEIGLLNNILNRILECFQNEKVSSAQLRLIWWSNTISLIKDNIWTGIGLGNFKIVYPLYHASNCIDPMFSNSYQLQHVHNDFLELISEIGIWGFLSFILIILNSFYQVYKIANSRVVNPYSKQILLYVSLSLINLLIICFFSFPLKRALPPILLIINIAYISLTFRKSVYNKNKYNLKHNNILTIFLILILSASFFLYPKIILNDKYYAEGLNFLRNRQLNKAEEQLKKSYQMFYNWNYNVFSLLGYINEMNKNYSKAITYYKISLKLHPNNINTLFRIAISYSKQQDFNYAKLYLKKFLTIMPQSAEGHANLGNIYFYQHNYKAAESEYKIANALNPNLAIARNNLRLLYSICRKNLEICTSR
ncbi:O-antigen ligase family protein [Dissulfuribacter thermophilus]|uniref:O-antigen ligase family protein n=1 Tax=Dissulfuribacter thermophilus TaxID=1156395 RepID=UPI00137A459C|nr:O-antigen ligase family protein [Dissulfuribacter thermophilus]